MRHDLIVLFEHPDWQKPLFSVLERRKVHFGRYDLKKGAFDPDSVPEAPRAVPLCLSLMRSLESGGARVLNGSRAFSLELSKSAQAALMQRLGIVHPRTLAFNDVDAALAQWGDHWPALLKPEQGGSGARMYLLHSAQELVRLLNDRPDLWLPDNLLLLQEFFEVDPAQGIVRMEFLGGELLYAMRVVSHGAFNLCPSEMCNPGDGVGSQCDVPETKPAKPVEFYPYAGVPAAAVEAGKSLMAAGGLDVGGIEYLEAPDGRLVLYDINANSNLRAPIAQAFGFDPFERVADFLVSQIDTANVP
jgi:glutathione synthase/RimK-type ligase-like ATP-grasp enzyme